MFDQQTVNPAVPTVGAAVADSTLPLIPAGVGIPGFESSEEEKEASAERKALVTRWLDAIAAAKEHHKDAFRKMKDDIKFAKGLQWPGQTKEDDRYVVNLCLRHIQQRVAALYAKNPVMLAKRKPRMDFALWDESPEQLQQVIQGMAMQDPSIQALAHDIAQGRARRKQLERIGKTLELLMRYYMNEQQPPFKLRAKQLIRRTETTGVGFIKLGFQRVTGQDPDTADKIADFSSRLAYLERLANEINEGEVFDGQAEIEELRLAMANLAQQPEIVLREGLVFDFPRSWSIIVDPACTELKGFIGANWVAQEFMFSGEKIEELYGVDEIGKKGAKEFARKTNGETPARSGDKKEGSEFRVFEIYDKLTGMMLTVCEGYDDFLEEPAAPRVFIEQFYPFVVLSFNDIEDDAGIYPPSDVSLLRSMQVETNRSREGLREHRIANRPAYGAAAGVLSTEDKERLKDHEAHELIEFAIPPGTPIENVLKGIPKIPIDPAVYDTSIFFDDIQKAVGSQEANFGGASGAAATEVSVAEGSRLATIQSNIDDLNDFLSIVARAASGILLKEISQETARKIAGPGAVWPEMTVGEIAEELYLDVEAGSSGRPNKAYELANFERAAPTLLQVPGITPKWLAKQIITRLDDNIDLTDAYLDGLPSIMAMNRQAQLSTGDPASDPNQQGGEGGDKNNNPQQRQAGAQPAYPTGA